MANAWGAGTLRDLDSLESINTQLQVSERPRRLGASRLASRMK